MSVDDVVVVAGEIRLISYKLNLKIGQMHGRMDNTVIVWRVPRFAGKRTNHLQPDRLQPPRGAHETGRRMSLYFFGLKACVILNECVFPLLSELRRAFLHKSTSTVAVSFDF